MSSCLYECNIMHCRTKPKHHKFNHKVFMFYLNLNEIDSLAKKMFLLGHNRASVFSFKDEDHMQFGGLTTKDNVVEFMRRKGVDWQGGRIMLLTNLRTLGHLFNPVSFYFCFDQQNNPICAIPEIGNTFGELKPYMLGPECYQNGVFRSEQTKHFYISPFVDLETPMDFQIRIPEERLNIKIDDRDEKGKFLYATMSGPRKELTNTSLLWYGLKFPLITVKVLTLIHWHASVLHFKKKVPYRKKKDNPHLQKEVQRASSKN